jgi:hypothetical protein
MKPANEPVIQDAALVPHAHASAQLLEQVDSAGDVGVDDVSHLVEILAEEALAQAVPGVGEQHVHGAPFGGGVKMIDALERGEVNFDDPSRDAASAERLGGFVDLGSVCACCRLITQG